MATKIVEYIYDAFDRRTVRKVDATADGVFETIDHFIFDGEDVALEFGIEAGQTELRHRYLHGPAVDQILAAERRYFDVAPPEHRVVWPLTDAQGTVRDLVNNNGGNHTHYVYDAFGNRTGSGSLDTMYGYTGREWDSATKLNYHRARWYDPAVGKWINEDPIGFGGGDYNLSRYVGNGATNWVDPSGKEQTRPFTYFYQGFLEILEQIPETGTPIDRVVEKACEVYGYPMPTIPSHMDHWPGIIIPPTAFTETETYAEHLDHWGDTFAEAGLAFGPVAMEARAAQEVATVASKTVTTSRVARQAAEYKDEAAAAARRAHWEKLAARPSTSTSAPSTIPQRPSAPDIPGTASSPTTASPPVVPRPGSMGKPRTVKVQPVKDAGPHTGFKRNPQTGEITGHTTFDEHGFKTQRTDVTGSSHDGVPTPHTHVYGPPDTAPDGRVFQGREVEVRPASPSELPRPKG